jgi:pyruvate carboxylase
MREVNFELNGQKRTVYVRDEAVASTQTRRMKADSTNAMHIGAPMLGEVVAVKVAPGDVIQQGQVVAVLSAMKMEMAVQSKVAGKVRAIHVAVGDKIDGEDLIIEVEDIVQKNKIIKLQNYRYFFTMLKRTCLHDIISKNSILFSKNIL